MKLVSKALLFVAKRIPIGYWRIINFVASRDSALWDYPIQLKCCAGRVLRADLRESVYTGLFRAGAIPHQLGFDRVCKRLLRSADVVFDVGANVGYTSMLFSSLVGENGLVVGLEPVPRSFDLLQRSCGGVQNIKCVNVAASSMPGELRIHVSDMLDKASAIGDGVANYVAVKADTLDSLASTYGLPQFVKIDVEGFEETVIEGMKQILGMQNAPIIIFEALNDSCRIGSRTAIERYAVSGYSFYRIGSGGELLNFDDSHGSSDYLAMPEWAAARLS